MTWLKWTATIISVIGVIWIDLKLPHFEWSFVVCSIGSGLWIWAAFEMKERSLLLQSAIFGLLNVIGIYRWFFERQNVSKIVLTDIDDTILKFADAFQKWAVESKGYVLNQSIRDGGSIQDAIGCHRDHVDELIIEFSQDSVQFSTIEPEPDALAVLPVLNNMGYKIVAISSCVDGPAVTTSRQKNLKAAFGFDFYHVHCVGLLQPKKLMLQSYEPAWWVEDNFGHSLVGAEVGHETFLLDRAYNRKEIPSTSTVRRVKNWHDVLEAIVRSERDAA